MINKKAEAVGEAMQSAEQRKQQDELEKNSQRGILLFREAVCNYCWSRGTCPAHKRPEENLDKL